MSPSVLAKLTESAGLLADIAGAVLLSMDFASRRERWARGLSFTGSLDPPLELPRGPILGGIKAKIGVSLLVLGFIGQLAAAWIAP